MRAPSPPRSQPVPAQGWPVVPSPHRSPTQRSETAHSELATRRRLAISPRTGALVRRSSARTHHVSQNFARNLLIRVALSRNSPAPDHGSRKSFSQLGRCRARSHQSCRSARKRSMSRRKARRLTARANGAARDGPCPYAGRGEARWPARTRHPRVAAQPTAARRHAMRISLGHSSRCAERSECGRTVPVALSSILC